MGRVGLIKSLDDENGPPGSSVNAKKKHMLNSKQRLKKSSHLICKKNQHWFT